jgi:UDP-2,3-diacylglucosamine hydrolase
MTTLFISDLHLDPRQEGLIEIFHRFLQGPARSARALYMLGDLFERWIGDDGDVRRFARELKALRALSDSGVALYFMHGNYDFLVGQRFAAATGASLLEDPTLIDLGGIPTLLSHGDALCTDDVAHQRARARWLDPDEQARVLKMPVWFRRAIALWLKYESRFLGRGSAREIVDVNEDAVRTLMRSHGVHQLVHGHTHRPAIHQFELDGAPARRIVLPNWTNESGGMLVCDASGCSLKDLS